MLKLYLILSCLLFLALVSKHTMRKQKLINFRQPYFCSKSSWRENCSNSIKSRIGIRHPILVMASLGGGELPIIGRIQESKQTLVSGSVVNYICSVDILGPALFGKLWSRTLWSLNPQDYVFSLVTHATLKKSTSHFMIYLS